MVIERIKEMAGKIKSLIDQIIEKRAKGNPLLADMTKTKMIMKGIDPSQFSSASPDDPSIIEKLSNLARELKISI